MTEPAEEGGAPQASLVQRAIAGFGWVFTSMIAARLITFLSFSVLGRILSVPDFGVLQIPLILNGFLNTVGDMGTGAALVRQKKDVEKAALVTLGFNIVLQTFWFAVTWAMAEPLASFFERPDAAPAIRALAFIYPIEALAKVHDALLLHDLSFRRRALPEITRAVMKGIASIALAFAGFGIWALVWGQIIGTIAWVIAQWMAIRWVPWEHLDSDSLSKARASFNPMLAFGSQVVLVNILAGLLHNLDKPLAGKIGGVTTLGLYSAAARVPEAFVTTLTYAVGRVAFPAFARAGEQGPERTTLYLGALRFISLATLPVATVLALLPGPILVLAFGEQWREAAAFLPWLALAAAFRSMGSHAGDLFKGAGRPDLLRNLALVKACITLPALLLAGLLTQRAEPVAMALALSTLVTSALNVVTACWVLDMRVSAPLREIVPALLASAAVAAVVLGSGPLVRGLPETAAVLAQLALAGFAFAVLAWRLAPELRAVLRSLPGVARTRGAAGKT